MWPQVAVSKKSLATDSASLAQPTQPLEIQECRRLLNSKDCDSIEIRRPKVYLIIITSYRRRDVGGAPASWDSRM